MTAQNNATPRGLPKVNRQPQIDDITAVISERALEEATKTRLSEALDPLLPADLRLEAIERLGRGDMWPLLHPYYQGAVDQARRELLMPPKGATPANPASRLGKAIAQLRAKAGQVQAQPTQAQTPADQQMDILDAIGDVEKKAARKAGGREL